MAHVMKHNRAVCGVMFKHYERAKDEFGKYISYGKSEIDRERCHLNYNLAVHQKMSQGDFVKRRCSEVRVLNRKDVNVMCSWVVTAPKSLPEQDLKRFFEESYRFLTARYGLNNVVSAFVHMDETTPHMHFAFVPVVEDKRCGGYKVSAKEAVDRNDLRRFHADLDAHMTRVFGRNIGILNEVTREGNKSVEELKRGTAIETLKNARKSILEVQGDIECLNASKNALEGQIERLEGKILTLQEVNQVKIKKRLFGGPQSVIEMVYQDAVNLKMTAQRIGEVEDQAQKLAEAYEELEIERDQVSKLSIERQLEQVQLLEENERLRDQVSLIDLALEKRPDIAMELQKAMNGVSRAKRDQDRVNRDFER